MPYETIFDSKNNPPALQNIIDSGLFSEGNMLIQSPYNTEMYEEASKASELFALEKHIIFSTLCGLLGAKKVTISQFDKLIKSKKTSLMTKIAKIGLGRGQISTESEAEEKLMAGINLEDEFTGGPANIEAAEQLLRRHRLLKEPSMRSLIDLRSNGMNQIKKRTLNLDLTGEAKNNLKVAGRFRAPQFIELSASYKEEITSQKEYRLEIEIIFDETA